MRDKILLRAANLLSVKSIVTLMLTVVFSIMACQEKISQDFMTIYAVIIAFYFGTQSQKMQEAVDQMGQNDGESEGSAGTGSNAAGSQRRTGRV